MAGMTGLGVAIGLWFVIPVTIHAAATGDLRALGQAFGGLLAAAAAGPTAIAVATALRDPVLATASLQFDLFWVFQAVMVALCLISAVVFWRMPETSGT